MAEMNKKGEDGKSTHEQASLSEGSEGDPQRHRRCRRDGGRLPSLAEARISATEVSQLRHFFLAYQVNP
jgi:hypothetical protein